MHVKKFAYKEKANRQKISKWNYIIKI
jgi:hypothetical protein